jgi:hypothetical protein
MTHVPVRAIFLRVARMLGSPVDQEMEILGAGSRGAWSRDVGREVTQPAGCVRGGDVEA